MPAHRARHRARRIFGGVAARQRACGENMAESVTAARWQRRMAESISLQWRQCENNRNVAKWPSCQ